jgi:uncharacterized protein YaiI (UPF0178 family)
LIEIFVDADACPVKDEVYRVAARYDIYVVLVANARIRTPEGLAVEMVVVDSGPDEADNWIADHVRAGDVVITGDIPLAARCLEVGCSVLGSNGRPFDEDMIGAALATRQLKSDLREAGVVSGGPAALSTADRSRFLSQLDNIVQAAMRKHPG